MKQEITLAISVIAWVILGIAPYLLSLKVRKIIDINGNNQLNMKQFCSHVFEWWTIALGFVIGMGAGSSNDLTLFPTLFAATIGCGLLGYLGMLSAKLTGYITDVTDHMTRAHIYIVVAIAVFMLGAYLGGQLRGYDLLGNYWSLIIIVITAIYTLTQFITSIIIYL